MNDTSDSRPLDARGCCEGDSAGPGRYNPPGHSEIAYRAGTHSVFLRRLVRRLARPPAYDPDRRCSPLVGLSTRAGDDPAIALLDAWAAVGDVLSFYQERIANEGFLRTATERRSVLELARAIGYELNPGVAAETYLAFSVDDAPGAPATASIPVGTAVQSIPAARGELPQTFETVEAFEARATWNALRARLSQPQNVRLNVSELWLQGTEANLRPGDKLLLVTHEGTAVKTVREIEPEAGRTRISFEERPTPSLEEADTQEAEKTPPEAEASPLPFTRDNVKTLLLDQELTESAFQATLLANGWAAADYIDLVNQIGRPATTDPNVQVFALREKLGIFGHNAPYYDSLPVDLRDPEGNNPFHNWDDDDLEGWSIRKDTRRRGSDAPMSYTDADIFLEREVPGIPRNSWLVLESPRVDNSPVAIKIEQTVEVSLAGFGLSAKATGLDLGLNDDDKEKYGDFKVRQTTAYVKSEALPLAERPLPQEALPAGFRRPEFDAPPLPAGTDELELDGPVLDLRIGQAVALSGERADAPGVRSSEILRLRQITHRGGYTRLHFATGLRHSYQQSTVTLSANLVRATHGETVPAEILGSGDTSQANQRFVLKKPPLTYVSAATAGGAASTLSLRVNGLAWREAPALFGLDGDSQRYILRRTNRGDTLVIFGDGQNAARLPTGQENVVATYRSGIGAAGQVGAGSLTLLQTRPMGVRSVTNPTAAGGAAEPETTGQARQNAPLTVLTLDRVVSRQDYEDFARSFAGVGKARAAVLGLGERHVVHITIAAPGGGAIDSSSALFGNLLAAINAARDPLQEVRLAGYQPLSFNVRARVLIDPAARFADVRDRLEAALSAAFGFDRRDFGQPVTAAEVVSAMHRVAGVTAVDLDGLALASGPQDRAPLTLAAVLPARGARLSPNTGQIEPAQLLLINQSGISLTEMAA